MAHKLTLKQMNVLKELGLSESQTKLYVASLEHGVLSVLQLSKLTGINRQQIYEEAERLTSLGLYELTGKQKRKYIAANPDKLLDVGKNKVEEAEKILLGVPALVSSLGNLESSKKNEVVTRYYEGLKQIKEAYNNELKLAKNTEVLSLVGLLEEFHEFFPAPYWEKWNEQFTKSQSTARMLVHKSDVANTFAQQQNKSKLKIKHLPTFPLKANIDVFNNTVLVVSFHDELAVWIESNMLAQSYRTLFNVLWEQARDF